MGEMKTRINKQSKINDIYLYDFIEYFVSI